MKLTKKEKFSIRKHKFGVSSILVGSIIGLTMLMTKEAEAEEVERNLSKQQIQHNNDATGDTQDDNNYNNEISNQEATTQNKQITQSNNVNSEAQAINEISDSHRTVNKATEALDNNSTLNTSTDVSPATKQDTTTSNQTTQENNDATTQTKTNYKQDGNNNVLSQVATNDNQSSNQPRNSHLNTSTVTYNNNHQVRRLAKVEATNTDNNVTQTSDISNKLSNVTATIEAADTIHPHKAEYVNLNYRFQAPDDVQAGDSIKITIPQALNLNGVTATAKAPNIMAGDQILATGTIDEEGNLIYTFTDYVTNKNNITGQISIPGYIDPKNVTHTGKVNLETSIGQTTAKKTVTVDYEKYGEFRNLSIKGTID